ncbi:MAG: LLM class flavin-dependent oxidoreductase [Chloroflexota bacterium]|nr:MAG: LLM class flavin-dependent oxidoreductase [Chloroflexota bacterium]
MEIGIGLDPMLGLPPDELRGLARDAADHGFASVWTPAGATGFDAFHTCVRWFETSGLPTGISVIPAGNWSAVTLAAQAATVSTITRGTFTLGIGANPLYEPHAREMFGLPNVTPLTALREYAIALRGLLGGESVTLEGKMITLRGVSLGIKPPPTPVFVAALGPKTLQMAGRHADGVLPNWASPEQVAWCRERIAEGARAAGRDPSAVPITQYIRVCVDEDVPAARRALSRQVVNYALLPTYRAHFERMGFADALVAYETGRADGADANDLLDRFPDELIRKVGYFGGAAEAPAAFKRLATGLDTAVVRVITARKTAEAVRETMRALAPERVRAA